MEKQAELMREKDELDRLMAEMKLEDEEKKRWYANSGCIPHSLCNLKHLSSFLTLQFFPGDPKLIVGVCPCSQRQISAAYQADLCAQIELQKQLRSEERAQTEREHRQRQMEEELYRQRTDELLSRPESKPSYSRHPFR